MSDVEPLPFELVNTVVDTVYESGDMAAVQACTLVSRLWGLASRPYVFRKLTLTTEDKLRELEALIDGNPCVGSWVRDLTVQSFWPSNDQLPETLSWIANVPPLASKLTRLRTFQFIDICEYGEYMENDFFHAISAFTTVDRLVLRGCALAEHFIFALVTAFPRLRHLSIASPRPMTSMLFEAPSTLHPLHLISLDLDLGQRYPGLLESFMEWLISTPSRTSLIAFGATVRMLDSATIGNFIDVVGGRLEQLEIRLRQYVLAPMEYEREFLLYCPLFSS